MDTERNERACERSQLRAIGIIVLVGVLVIAGSIVAGAVVNWSTEYSNATDDHDGVAVTPDEDHIIAGQLGSLYTFNRSDNYNVEVVDNASSLSFSAVAVNDSLAVVGVVDDSIRVYDTDTWSMVRSFTPEKEVHSIAFNPSNNSEIAVAEHTAFDDAVINIYNVDTGNKVESIPQTQRSWKLDYSRDGKYLGFGEATGDVYLYHASNYTQHAVVNTSGVSNAARGFAFSPDSGHFVFGESGTTSPFDLVVYEVDSLSEVARFSNATTDYENMVWAPNAGQLAASTDNGNLFVYDASPFAYNDTVAINNDGANLYWSNNIMATSGFGGIEVFDSASVPDAPTGGDGGVSEDEALQVETRDFLEHNTTVPFRVYYEPDNSTRINVTTNATVTVENTSVVTVDQTAGSMTSTSDVTINQVTWVNATYQGENANKSVVVANETIENVDILPPMQKWTATIGDDNTLVIIVATAVAAGVALYATSLAGLGAFALVIIGGWLGGFTADHTVISALLVTLFVGLNVSQLVEFDRR